MSWDVGVSVSGLMAFVQITASQNRSAEVGGEDLSGDALACGCGCLWKEQPVQRP